MLQTKSKEELATSYTRKVANSIEEQGTAYEAYLAGYKQCERSVADEYADNINKIIDICLYDLNASCDRATHKEYIEYRLKGGELSEEEWFLKECN